MTTNAPIPEDVFDPIALELGRLVYAWNELHEELGQIFEAVVRPKQYGTALAAWRATESDRMQRKMLEYSVLATNWEKSTLPTIAKDDILWVIEKAGKLADLRNDAVHAPYARFHDEGVTKIVPFDFFGNPRAMKLNGKDLPTEFEYCHRRTRVLSGFTVWMGSALREKHIAWPERPTLPER